MGRKAKVQRFQETNRQNCIHEDMDMATKGELHDRN